MKWILLRYLLASILPFLSGLFALVLVPLTALTAFLLLSIVYPVRIDGPVLSIASAQFSIISACAATLAYILLAELILLTGGISFSQGLRMFCIGALLIFSMNIVRVVLLIALYMEYGKNTFDTVHILFWHLVSTFFVAAVWIFIVEWYKIRTFPVLSDIKHVLR